jgi:photosystem II stability/assembly factor-like uncharacterized protein
MRKKLLFQACLFCWFVGPVQAAPDLLFLGPDGGDVRSLSVHPAQPERIFLGTADGQVYVSQNAGRKWEKVIPGLKRRELAVDTLVFDPNDADTLYAAGWELKSDRGALFRTRDGGHSWDRIDLGKYQSSIRAVAVSPLNPDLIAVGITEGVLLSKDGGTKWRRISRGYRSLHNVHSLAFDVKQEELLYVGTWRLAWKTPDLGESWVPIHGGMYWDSDLFSIQINPRDPNRLYAGACSGLYRSMTAGEKWAKLKNGLPGKAKRTRTVRLDPSNPDVVYAGTTAGLYRSVNGGDSWKCLLPDVVINAVVVGPGEGQRLVVGTDDAGVLRSDDGGESFLPSNQGFSQRQVSSVAVRGSDSEELMAAVTLDREYGGFFVSRDRGKNWEAFNAGLETAVAGIKKIVVAGASDEVFLGTGGGVFRGIPGKRDWERIPGTESLIVNDMEISDVRDEELFLAARQGLFSLDLKKNRLNSLKIPIYDREFSAVLVDEKSKQVFVGTDMGVFRSDDGGKTWAIKVEGLPYVNVSVLKMSGDRLLLGTRSGLYYSDDQAETWTACEGVYPLEIAAIESSLEGAPRLYAADSLVGYIFVSQDNGLTWDTLDVGVSLSKISSFSVTSSGHLYAGTLAEGVVRIILPSSAQDSTVIASK